MRSARRTHPLALAYLSLILLGANGCSNFSPVRADFKADAVLPNGSRISMTCAPTINYNSASIKISGIDVPISKVAGIDIKIGQVSLDQTTLRQASDLIEALDNAQFQYCRTLPFVAQQDVYKLWQDANTQQLALATLLRNLASAQSVVDTKAALDTAADTALIATPIRPTTTTSATKLASAEAVTPTKTSGIGQSKEVTMDELFPPVATAVYGPVNQALDAVQIAAAAIKKPTPQ